MLLATLTQHLTLLSPEAKSAPICVRIPWHTVQPRVALPYFPFNSPLSVKLISDSDLSLIGEEGKLAIA
jgi:hypothetical protein